MNRSAVLFLIAASALLAACSHSSSGNDDGSSVGSSSVGSSLGKTDLQLVAGATSNSVISDMQTQANASGLSSQSSSSLITNVVSNLMNGAGDLDAVSTASNSSCASATDVIVSTTDPITENIDAHFACPKISGDMTVAAEASFTTSSASLDRSTNLTIIGAADSAVLNRTFHMNAVFPALNVLSGSRTIQDQYSVSGVNYAVNETSTVAVNASSIVTLGGTLNISRNNSAPESFAITSSSDLHLSTCGLDSGSFTLQSAAWKVDVVFLGCANRFVNVSSI